MTEKAIQYFSQAGDNAVRLSANQEVVSHYQRALELLRMLPENPTRDRQELELCLSLGIPLLAIRGFDNEEVERIYSRALELNRKVKGSLQLYRVYSGLKNYFDIRLELLTALELGKGMLTLAQSSGDTSLVARAHSSLCSTLLYLGEMKSSLEHHDQTMAHYDPVRQREMVYQYGYDPYVSSLSNASWALWFLGYPEQAKQASAQARLLIKEVDNPTAGAYAYVFSAVLHHYLQNPQAWYTFAETAMAFSSQLRNPFWSGVAQELIGLVFAKEGRPEEGLAKYTQAHNILNSLGAKLPYLQSMVGLVEAYLNLGRIKEGLATVDESLATIHKTGFAITEPELYRLKGELLRITPGSVIEAESCFQKSIEIAQQRQAKSWELRATTSLCRLWMCHGKANEARQKLTEVYGWFTEGFDTPDLRIAKDLLLELA